MLGGSRDQNTVHPKVATPNPWLSVDPDLPGTHHTHSCGNFRHTYCFLFETFTKRCRVYLVPPG